MQLFRRDLDVRYRGSVLGLFWTLINPLVLMAAYTLVFSILLKAESIEYFPLFVLVGLLPWVFFQASVQTATHDARRSRVPRQAGALPAPAAAALGRGDEPGHVLRHARR